MNKIMIIIRVILYQIEQHVRQIYATTRRGLPSYRNKKGVYDATKHCAMTSPGSLI